MSTGNQCRICLISHIIGTEVKISPVTQQRTDTGTLFIQIDHVELLAGTYIRHSTSPFHNAQRLGSETLIIDRIYKIRILHVYRIKNTCFQAVFLIDQCFISHFPIEVTIITEQVCSHLDADLRIDSGNKYRRVSSQTVEHPLSKSFFIFHKVIVHPHLKRNRQKPSQHLRTGSFIKGRLNLCQGRPSYRCCRLILYDSFSSCIKYLPFGQMLCHRTTRK